MITEEEYNKLREKSEELENPDKKRINMYGCKLGHRFITIDREAGTTPMFTGCEYRYPVDPKRELLSGKYTKCTETANSRMYQVPQDLNPLFEWYRPPYEYYRDKLSWIMQDYVEQGGLCFRKIGDVDCYQ